MYNFEQRKAYVHIPKCGTLSTFAAFKQSFPDQDPNFLNGHRRVSEIEKILEHKQLPPRPLYVACIREPLKRFVSGLNHCYAQNPAIDLDKAFKRVLSGDRHIVFITQDNLFDIDCEKKLFRFEDLVASWEFCGCVVDKIPHVNQSIKRWTLEDVKKHPDIGKIEEMYKNDFDTYHSL